MSKRVWFLLLGTWLAAGGAWGAAGACEGLPTGELQLAADDEPGERLEVLVEIRARTGEPAAGVRIEAYQTDARGYYRESQDGAELGRDEARLRAAVCSDEQGRVRLDTIVPAVYPGGGPPAHIHFDVVNPDGHTRTHTLSFRGGAPEPDADGLRHAQYRIRLR